MANSIDVQIKGIRDGLIVTLGHGSWEEVRASFLTHIDRQKNFLKGARIAIEVGDHDLRAAELGKLRDEISGRGITLWAVISTSSTTLKTAQDLGLSTQLDTSRKTVLPEVPDETLLGGNQAVLVHRTLRSGSSLQYDGHVVIIGDVNPGAEIIATGNVVVWGHMRGMVHAGAEGDKNAVVCALDLSPTQLRIAGAIATTPNREGAAQPETARLQDGNVIAEKWNSK